MTIEETNKLRASLGLKPLSLGPKAKDAAVVNLQKTSAQVEQERERDSLQQAMARSRRKRELSTKLAGQSLGEQLQSTGSSNDALDWVKRSRVQQAAEPAAKKAKTSGVASDSYDSAALAGMTVAHTADSFEEGQDVVLTLKDARVLADDGHDVNDVEDELVNVELSERDRREAHQASVARSLMPAYSGVDDDEFIQMGGGRHRKKTSKLLTQYDEEEDAQAAEAARKFTLDASGGSKVDPSERSKAAEEEEDGVAVISLSIDRTRAVEDYYTQEEMAAQFSKKKGKKLRKKKKKLRHKTGEEEDEGGEQDTSSLIAQLEEEAQKHAAKDRGKRRRRITDDAGEIAEDVDGLKRFQEAREKANAVASDALAATRRKRRAPVIDDSDLIDDALDMELSASLARARTLAQSQDRQTESVAVTAEDKIAQLVEQTVGVASERGDDAMEVDSGESTAVETSAPVVPAGNVFGHAPNDADANTNAVVFNDASDFETRLRNAMEKRSAQFGAGGSMSEEPKAMAVNGSASATAVATRESTEDQEMKEDGSDEEKVESEEEKEGEVWGEEQPLVSRGIGATLALLRKTGDLRETHVERQAGRANDARDRNVDAELRVKDGVKLDYRDEFGRLLTKKEAFRMLSYKFHGHGPGKKKKEKRLRALKQELEAQKLLSGEGSSKMMGVLEKKQKAGQQAHVVLSSGS